MPDKYVTNFNMFDGTNVKIKDAELTERVTALENKANFNVRKFIFFGDSYNTGWTPDGTFTPWGQIAASQLWKTVDSSAFIVADSGGAFGRNDTDPQSFYASFKAFGDSKTTEFRNSITDIVIAGGANEYLYDISAIRNGMNSCGQYIASMFPNAQVWLFATGWNPYPARRQKLAEVYSGAYSYASYFNHWKYHEIFPLLHNRANMSSDLIHPVGAGQIAIGNAIALTILGGTPSMDSEAKPITSSVSQLGTAKRVGKFVVIEIKTSALAVADVDATTITKTSLPLTCDYIFGGYTTDQTGIPVSGVLRAANKFYNTTFTFKSVFVSDSDLSAVIGLCTNAINEAHNNFVQASDVQGIQLKEGVYVIDICKI